MPFLRRHPSLHNIEENRKEIYWVYRVLQGLQVLGPGASDWSAHRDPEKLPGLRATHHKRLQSREAALDILLQSRMPPQERRKGEVT